MSISVFDVIIIVGLIATKYKSHPKNSNPFYC